MSASLLHDYPDKVIPKQQSAVETQFPIIGVNQSKVKTDTIQADRRKKNRSIPIWLMKSTGLTPALICSSSATAATATGFGTTHQQKGLFRYLLLWAWAWSRTAVFIPLRSWAGSGKWPIFVLLLVLFSVKNSIPDADAFTLALLLKIDNNKLASLQRRFGIDNPGNTVNM